MGVAETGKTGVTGEDLIGQIKAAARQLSPIFSPCRYKEGYTKEV